MTGSPSLRELTPTRGFLLGVGAAVVGLLPSVLAGWQPSWPTYPNTPDLFTGTFLPFAPDLLALMLGAVVLPGAIVGVVLRPRTAGTPGRVDAAATAGLVLVIALAALQSVAATVPRLRPETSGLLDVAVGLTAVAVALVLSALVSRVLAHRTVPAATVAAAVVAVAAGYWLQSVLRITWSWGLQLPDGVIATLAVITQVAPAVLLGAALAWCGWTPRRRLWAWTVALLIFGVGQAVLDAATYWFVIARSPGSASPAQYVGVALDGLVWSLPYAAAAILVGVVGRLVAPHARRRYREKKGTVPTA
ncbi:hypothetical protein [Isoptericola sediminis]|uniref:Uncharacterized protein n=1 Tax=Isoptericola sediminis TaxID=2733572 RepID=A0A849K800_9MICO|nr:hypothetical protein [Isoptericola sediminis]NNU28580.1 hypothetical protein [Isoptericola sediminis]